MKNAAISPYLRPAQQLCPDHAFQRLEHEMRSSSNRRVSEVSERLSWRLRGGAMMASSRNRVAPKARRVCLETMDSPIPHELLNAIGFEEGLVIPNDLIHPSPGEGYCMGMVLAFIGHLMGQAWDEEGVKVAAKVFERGATADAVALQNYYGELTSVYARVDRPMLRSYAQFIVCASNGTCHRGSMHRPWHVRCFIRA